ncbi:MAG: metallophosphoesterase family protein [Phycisphaeraceae bacterium]|nr:metallophosphoesterase family protein [Phycisphaeraceae bacterium]
MPTAVVSDIHANLEALQTVLADIKSRGITRVVCLGDIIGYGPDPLACVDLVKQHCEWSLMGNHDFGVLYEPTNFNPGAESAAFWTREAFDAEPNEARRRERYEFLGRLRVRIVDSLGNGRVPVLNVHGSPRRPINEYIFPDDVQTAPDKLSTIFERVQRVCFVGHTHVPGVFTDEPDFYPPGELTASTYNFSDSEKAIINVGSVGQPRDFDPRASYVIVYAPGEQGQPGASGETPNIGPIGGVQFIRLPYDVESTARKIKAIPQLSDWLGDRLFEGR